MNLNKRIPPLLNLLEKHLVFISLLILSVSIRLMLIHLTPFKIDMDAWVAWTYRLADGGLSQFYNPNVWTNYTPGYLYPLFLLGKISTVFSLNQQTIILIIKFFSILFELLTAIFIYTKLTSISQKQRLYLTGFLLFNPAFVFNSTIWGQIDGILSYFFLLSVYLLQNNQLQKSSLSYAYAFLLKPQSIALSPLFIIELIKKPSVKKTLHIFLPGIWLFFLLSIPFFAADPVFGIFKLIYQMSQDYPANSLFAYNLWGTIGFWVDDLKTVGPFSYRIIGTTFFILSILSILFLGLKKNANYYLLASLLCLSFFFIPTRVHERYLYPALPFLLISSFLFKNKMLLLSSIFLSLIYTLNLYYVYIYYNVTYLHLDQTLMSKALFYFLDQNGKLMSLLSSFIFIMIVIIITKIIYVQKSETPNHSK